jgi:hypothetical protein
VFHLRAWLKPAAFGLNSALAQLNHMLAIVKLSFRKLIVKKYKLCKYSNRVLQSLPNTKEFEFMKKYSMVVLLQICFSAG